jgi:hypothetical protein
LGKKLQKGRGVEQAKGVAKALDVLSIGDEERPVVSVTEEECEGEEECFDITRNRFPERTRSLSSGLTSSNTAAAVAAAMKKKEILGGAAARNINPGANVAKKQSLEDCEGEECFDITRNRFAERTRSLSTSLSPSNTAAVGKKQTSSGTTATKLDQDDANAAAEKQSSEVPNIEDCEGEEECFDITQSTFQERTKSLSTGLPPSNTVRSIERERAVTDFLPKRQKEGHYDITQNLFPEQRRAASTFSNLAFGKVDAATTVERNPDTEVFDITQNLFPKQRASASAFRVDEKSEMNNRPPPQSMDGSFVHDINKVQTSGDRAALSLSVNSGPTKSEVDALKSAADEGSVVELASGAKVKAGRESTEPSSDITQQHFASERPSASVNTGGVRRTSFELSDEYVDITKQHFRDRSSFSQLVNSGTKKESTTYGSWDESRLLPMPERTKDASWRWRKTSKSEYLDKPRFSSDLSPPSFGKPGLSESRQPLSTTANMEPRQRFNTSEASYRDIITSADRRPLSATANAATQQRFNTSAEIYRDSSVSLEPQPLSVRANAAPKQRFNTAEADSNPSSSPLVSSIAYAPPRMRFKTSEEGYKNNPVLSRREPLEANAAPEQRFKTKGKTTGDMKSSFFSSTDSKDARPLLDVHSNKSRFNIVGRKTLLSSVKEEVGIDIPRAFSSSIEMVTVSPGKNLTATRASQYVDDVRFSTELSSPSKVTSVTASKGLDTNSADKPRFSTNLLGPSSDATPKVQSKTEPPLSMTIHSTSDRFNTTKKSSSLFASQTVGFDVPRAFTRNIDMVTTSEAKKGNNEDSDVDKITFSPNLSVSTAVKNVTTTRPAAEEEFGPDVYSFSPILSESTTIREVDYSQSKSQVDVAPMVDRNQFSSDLTRLASPRVSKSTSRHPSENEGVPLVDENRFSSDLTRVSNAKHKPGAAMKSTPHRKLDENLGIDLNLFSPVPNLAPPSKVRVGKSSNSQQDSADQLLDLSSRNTVNVVTTKPARSAHAANSKDPFVDLPTFSKPETLIGPLRVRDLTKAAAGNGDDLGVDRVGFSPASKLRPPSQVRLLRPKTEPMKEPKIRAPHVNPYFLQLALDKVAQKIAPKEEVSADKFLDLTSQYTVNNSSMTALGQHAIRSDDPYVDVAKFSNPSEFAPPSKVKTYRAVDGENADEEDYFDITRASLSGGSLARNVSSVRDAISAAKPSKMSLDQSSSLLRNMSSIRDAITASKPKAESLQFDSLEDEVQHWLLSRLSYLDNHTAALYTERLIEDGFDSSEMLGEILEDDLKFMDNDDRESLIFRMDLKYWLLAYLPNLEEADITLYSTKLIDDGFDSFEMLDELTKDDVSFMKAAHRQELTRQLPKRTNNILTESNAEFFEEASFDITRKAFRERPSLAAVPIHHESSANQPQRSQSALAFEEESFDITRVAFSDRPQQPQVSELQMDQSQSSVVDRNDIADNAVTPKAELYQFYISRGLSGEQAAELADFYTVWTNEERLFTCIFTCPISGESFIAGSWKEGGDVVADGSLYWYSE